MEVETTSNQYKKNDNKKIKEQKKEESKVKKSKKTKEYKTKLDDGFQKPKTSRELAFERKEDRINRKNQIRRQKINENLFKRRGLIDSDGNSSLDISKNKSMTLSNLTQLIDLTVYKIPPKICALISLNEDADLDKLIDNIEKIILINLNEVEKNNKYNYILNQNIKSYIIPGKLYKGKERITFIKTKRDIYSILDTCKIADILLFVSSCKKCQADKWQIDPDKYSFCIDEFGYQIISIIKAQGLTDHICCIQDLNSIPVKRRTEIVKLYSRYFTSELKPSKIFDFFNNEPIGQDSNMDLHDENQIKAIIRLNCAKAPYTTNLDLQKHRSYMMVEDIKKIEDNEAEIFGYIRGNTLIPGKYIHITGFGDYKIKDVEVVDDPLPVKSKFDKKGEMEVEKNINTNNKEDNKKKNEEMENNINNDIVESRNNLEEKNDENLPEKIEDIGGEIIEEKNKKESKNKNNMEEEDDIIDFNINLKDDEDDISYKSDENFEKEDEEEKQKISNKHKQKTSIQYRTKEEMEFQDEVDTPIDIPAKERFKKYRGLDSMKTGSWNPLANLPKEYRTIFSFENIKNTYKLSVKRAHNDGLKLNGNYIKIIVKNFDFDNLKYYNKEIPMVLSTLLDHERKLCVMHYKFTANYEQDNTIVENMNKNIFECHCGFRRYLIKPIFSNEVFTGGDKLKIQRYLEKDKFYIMTTYAQLTYPNSPIILFTHKTLDNDIIDNKLSFCGTGSTLEANDKKVILKKIILTGYPVKIKKKKAIVRYMFFNPNDINYFKPIQLSTKKGLRGNITESVGTHGYMKCIFSDYIKSNDTVCLNLYKRVFPKYFKETWKYKVFYGNREDYLSYFKPRENKEFASLNNTNENENTIGEKKE